MVVNGAEPATTQGSLGIFELLFGQRKAPPAKPVEAESKVDPRDDPRNAAVHAREEALLKLSLSSDLKLAGYDEAPENVPTWNKLQTTTLSSHFVRGLTLEEACDYFKDQTKIDFLIDWRALKECGLGPQGTSVTVEIGTVNVASAIARVLENVVSKGGEGPSGQLAFDVQGGMVVVTTLQEANRRQVTYFYDVWDLFVSEPGEGEAVFALYHGYSDSWLFDDLREVVDRLKQLIYDQVDANWEERGAGKDRIAEFDGRFVITASRHAHREISALLAQIRTVRRHVQR
jgi:hypothetical protein